MVHLALIKSKQAHLGALILLVLVVVIIGFNIIKHSTSGRESRLNELADKSNKLGKVEQIEYDFKNDKYVITLVFKDSKNIQNANTGYTDTVTITVEEHLLKPVLKNYEIPETITALKDLMEEDLKSTEKTADAETPVKQETPVIKEKPVQKTVDKTQTSPKTEPVKQKATPVSTDASGIVFRVQFLMSKKDLSLDDPKFDNIKDVMMYREGRFYKYAAGSAKDFNTVKKNLEEILPYYPQAFIIAFNHKERIPVLDAKKIVRHSRK